MLQCWRVEPADRLTFTELAESIEGQIMSQAGHLLLEDEPIGEALHKCVSMVQINVRDDEPSPRRTNDSMARSSPRLSPNVEDYMTPNPEKR